MSIVPATVPFFDPKKYTGDWYSLASMPLIYEKDCYRSMANYSYDCITGQIKLVNTCIKADGTCYTRSGVGRIPDSESPGKLIIKFTDGLPSGSLEPSVSTIPADPGWSPYWIHWTDYDNYSIVGVPSGEFLWILGRKKQTTADNLFKLATLIKTLGYDLNKINIGKNVMV